MSVSTLGRHSYSLATLETYPGNEDTNVLVGNYSSIAAGVIFVCGGEHRPDWVTTSPIRGQLGLAGAGADGLPASRGDIVVGSDVWIGHGAMVLSGVHIGDGAVIGAGAVVRMNVRPYAIVIGNPAHELRRRFDDATVDALLRIRWWDWTDDWITAEVAALSSANVAEFIEAHG